ncbi:MAG TPA: STAS domain-containing protein [Actinomycetota bacterium]|nr:STAS domain-containing protein [Actinomycetota bacterium]
MSSATIQTDGHQAPIFTTAEQSAMRDLWTVYDDHYDEISQEAERGLAEDPEFGPLIKGMSRDLMEQQNQRSRALMRDAMRDGRWEPYLADLLEQGANYARMGLSFVSWYRAIGVIRPSILRRLRAAYSEDPDRLLGTLKALGQWFDTAMSTIGDAYLNTKEQIIVEQQEAIRELSTPVLTLMDGLLLLPVVGLIDSHRARQMTDHLLQGIHRFRAKVVVIDITGVAAVDTMVANHLIQAVEAARLLGATAIVTGLSADVAQTVVKIGVDLSRLHTVGDLQGGVSEAMEFLGYRLERTATGTN